MSIESDEPLGHDVEPEPYTDELVELAEWREQGDPPVMMDEWIEQEERATRCPECGEQAKPVTAGRVLYLRCRCGWQELVDVQTEPDQGPHRLPIGYGDGQDAFYWVTLEQLVGARLIFCARTLEEHPEWYPVRAVAEVAGEWRVLCPGKSFAAEKVLAGIRDRRILLPRPWRDDLVRDDCPF